MGPIRIKPGVLSAISAGALFGASTPLAKSLVHGIDLALKKGNRHETRNFSRGMRVRAAGGVDGARR
jgi:hypothetical protein